MNERSFITKDVNMTDELITRGDRARGEILQAAHRLFVERGFHGTSMRQIAQEAGIALGGIYNHFSSKEDIFASVFLERNPYLDVIPLLKTAQGDTVEELVRDAANRLVDNLEKRKDFLNLMFIELVEFKGQHIPQIFQRIFPEIMGFAQRFTTSQGELRPIPLLLVVRAFVGLFFSFMITDILIAEQLPPEMRENALDHFVDIYLHGILRQDAPAEEAR
jgi:AcrR family transcriptional regulator